MEPTDDWRLRDELPGGVARARTDAAGPHRQDHSGSRLDREALRKRLEKQKRSALRLPGRLSHAAHVGLQLVYWTVTLQLGAGMRRRRDARLIRSSGLFDEQFYRAQCPDERGARVDPLNHYLTVGAARGLDPSPLFDTSEWAALNPASIEAGANPLAAFIRSRSGTPTQKPPAADRRGPLLLPPPEGTASIRPPSGPPSVVTVQPRVAEPSGATVRTKVELLREMGYAVDVVWAEEPAGEPDTGAFAPEGVTVLRGVASAAARLAAEGQNYRFAFLAGAEHAFRYMPLVRAHAARAAVIYENDAQAREPGAAAGQLGRMNAVNVACADLVCAGTDEECAAVARDVPDACVQRIPRDGPGPRDMERVLAAASEAAGKRDTAAGRDEDAR